ncbi:hypothetical protein LTR53_004460 [Teratosphaeriaceae sp. CCFEE 6253]|nr:hypothetical protein LTR53_004460 [Teratosphaeriaceae sp. CCFEE 6253]
MGLPIWRDPEGTKATRDAVKTDPTAAARSSIRRRPSIHGRRSSRPRLTRDATVHNSRVEPPSASSTGASSTRDPPRRTTTSGVPPVSTLLDSANRQDHALPPPPVSESRNYYAPSVPVSARDSTYERDMAVRQAAAMRRYRLLERGVDRQRDGAAATETRLSRASRELPLPPAIRYSQGASTDENFDAGVGERQALPTPPLETSDTEGDSLFVPEVQPSSRRGTHPLRNSWSPDSPVDGLGDRNRSPTPADGWEIMRSTITPDATLPSADSSFTSTAASRSFGGSAPDTTITEPERASSSSDGQRNTSDDSQSDSASSLDDLCDDEDTFAGAEDMAEFMFDYENSSAAGRQRILEVEEQRHREGNRFALAHESPSIDIGFRLIEIALETDEGRDRLIDVGVLAHSDDADELLSLRGLGESRRSRNARHHHSTRARITDDAPPPPDPSLYSAATRAAVREASAQVHDTFRRYTSGSLRSRARSPPPRYEPLASHPDVEIFTSRDEPQAYPVSPPTRQSQTEVTDAMLSGDEAELSAMRRVVERLARRDDVPDEWWSSIGLNLSRTRPRTRSPRRVEDGHAAATIGDRVRAGRIERRDSRL